jgi:hypothetical protein
MQLYILKEGKKNLLSGFSFLLHIDEGQSVGAGRMSLKDSL